MLPWLPRDVVGFIRDVVICKDDNETLFGAGLKVLEICCCNKCRPAHVVSSLEEGPVVCVEHDLCMAIDECEGCFAV